MSQSRTIRDIFSSVFPAVDEATLDSVYLAELQLTRAEFERLLEEHGDKVVPSADKSDPLKPFRDFLAKRWARISAVSKVKLTAADVCYQTIAEMSKTEIETAKKEYADAQAKLQAKQIAQQEAEAKKLQQQEVKATRVETPAEKEARREKIFADARLRAQKAEQEMAANMRRHTAELQEKTRKDFLQGQKNIIQGVQEQIRASEIIPKKITGDMTEEITGRMTEVITEEKQPKKTIKHTPIENLRTKLLLKRRLVRKIILSQPKGTDLIYSTAPNQPANILCTNVAKSIDAQDRLKLAASLKKEVKPESLSKHVNSLLMPTVESVYYYYDGNAANLMSLDKLSPDKVILTENGKGYIPVFHTMMRAAKEAKETGNIEFKAGISVAGGGARLLTASEQERLLNHSPAVREFYQAIKDSMAWKKEQEESTRKISIKAVLQNFVDGKYGKMTYYDLFSYLYENLDSVQRKKLYAMEFHYVPRPGKPGESTFEFLTQDFFNNKTKKEVNRNNLVRFLERNKFAFNDRNDLDVVPPITMITMDPLVLATPKFEAAMRHSSVELTPTYGDAGRQRLINQVYKKELFPAVIQAMHNTQGEPDIKKIIDYLQAMPDAKISAFVALLPPATLTKLLYDEAGAVFITRDQQENENQQRELSNPSPRFFAETRQNSFYLAQDDLVESPKSTVGRKMSLQVEEEKASTPLVVNKQTSYRGRLSDWLSSKTTSQADLNTQLLPRKPSRSSSK